MGSHYRFFFVCGLLAAIGIAVLGVLHLLRQVSTYTDVTMSIAFAVIFAVCVWYTRFRGRG